jgi:hypothetical protein
VAAVAGLLSAVAVLAGAFGTAGAQEPPPTTPAPPPVDPAATPAPTAPPPSQVLPTTSTLPLNCTEIPPPYVVFVGRITAYQVPTFRFQIDRVVSGTWNGPLIDVDFVDDSGFMRIGPTYLVAAQVDPATGKLYSKLRTSFRTQPGPGTCPGDDPIITRLADGSPVDTGLLSGMSGKWNKVLLAFLVPSVAVMAAFVLVVSLKHLVAKVVRTEPLSGRRYSGGPGAS